MNHRRQAFATHEQHEGVHCLQVHTTIQDGTSCTESLRNGV
jgi:hypothetical protein